jgi:hypothetical protein
MDALTWLLLTEGLTVLATLVAFIACLRIPRRAGTLFAPLAWLLGLALVVELAGMWTSILGTRNTFVYNPYLLVEFSVLLWMVWRLRPVWRAPLRMAWAIGAGAWLATLLVRGDMDFLFTPAVVVMAFILAGCCLMVLWHLADSSTRPLRRVPEFWLFLGLMLFFGGLAPLIGSLGPLYERYPELTRNLYTIITVLGYQRYVLAAVACVQARQDQLQWNDHER